MKLLLLGGGAREHALAWRLKHSPMVQELLAAPGNPGIARLARCLSIDPTDPPAVVELARREGVSLVVVGPEAPLVAGVADALRAAGIDVFGPGRDAARIEGSKAFAKEVMNAAGVPTARFETFTDARSAAARAREWGPVVVKADGLAAGKGVVVADSGEVAAAACLSLGATTAGATLVLEERLTGPEVSIIALCDGERWVLLPPAQDHKRALDGDHGPNTGGMGAYAPANVLSPAALRDVGETVIGPTLKELARRGAPFRGALYAGVMVTPAGPKVLEFNARLGDPETQPLMMLLDEDLMPLLQSCARGALSQRDVRVKSGSSVGVVVAAPGYPEAPRVGGRIDGLFAPLPGGVQCFVAGVSEREGALVTSGGRVLTMCAHSASFASARAAAYEAIGQVRFEGMHFRKDIGAHAP